MRGHVDAESLALDAEGLLSRRQSARVRSHLSGCPQCAATRQQLTEVTTLLGQVPAAPLPPAIAARLDLALDRGGRPPGRRPAAAGPPGGRRPAGGGRCATGRRHRRARDPRTAPRPRPRALTAPRPLQAARRRPARGRDGPGRDGDRRWGLRSPATLRLVSVAGAAVVLAAGGYGLSQLSSGPSGSTSSRIRRPGSARNGAAGLHQRVRVTSRPPSAGRQPRRWPKYHRREAQSSRPREASRVAPPRAAPRPAAPMAAARSPARPPGTERTAWPRWSLRPRKPPCGAAPARSRAGAPSNWWTRPATPGGPRSIIVLAAGGGQPGHRVGDGPGLLSRPSRQDHRRAARRLSWPGTAGAANHRAAIRPGIPPGICAP